MSSCLVHILVHDHQSKLIQQCVEENDLFDAGQLLIGNNHYIEPKDLFMARSRRNTEGESSANALFAAIESYDSMVGADRPQLGYPPLNSILSCEEDCGGYIFVKEINGVQKATQDMSTGGIIFLLGFNTLADVLEVVLVDSTHHNRSRLFLLAALKGPSPNEA